MYTGFEQLSDTNGCRVMAFSNNGQGYLLRDSNFYPIFGSWAMSSTADMLAN